MYCPAWLRTDRGGARVPAHRSPGHRRSDRGHPGRRDYFDGGVESVIRLALEYPVETLQEWRSSATLQVALPEHTRSQASFAPTPAGAVRRIPVTSIATPRDFSYTASRTRLPACEASERGSDPLSTPDSLLWGVTQKAAGHRPVECVESADRSRRVPRLQHLQYTSHADEVRRTGAPRRRPPAPHSLSLSRTPSYLRPHRSALASLTA